MRKVIVNYVMNKALLLLLWAAMFYYIGYIVKFLTGGFNSKKDSLLSLIPFYILLKNSFKL